MLECEPVSPDPVDPTRSVQQCTTSIRNDGNVTATLAANSVIYKVDIYYSGGLAGLNIGPAGILPYNFGGVFIADRAEVTIAPWYDLTLPPGETLPFDGGAIEFRVSLTSGNFVSRVQLTVDPDSHVAEADEANNFAFETFNEPAEQTLANLEGAPGEASLAGVLEGPTRRGRR